MSVSSLTLTSINQYVCLNSSSITNAAESRKQIYANCDIINTIAAKSISKVQILEVFGEPNLGEKYGIWDEYGQPTVNLYYSVESHSMVTGNQLSENDDDYPVAYITKKNNVIVMVDKLNAMREYAGE